MSSNRSHLNVVSRATTQHAHPADRFAREIAAILECDTSRSRRLMRNPFGCNSNVLSCWNAAFRDCFPYILTHPYIQALILLINAMLELSSPVWAELRHAYGSASDIPTVLAELYAAASEATWLFQDWDAEPLLSLGNALCHQGDVYPASYATLPHLVALAAKQPAPNRIICLNLVGCIAMGQQELNTPEIPSDLQGSYALALTEAAKTILECLQMDWPDDDYKVLLSALVAVRGHGSLARAILLS